MGPLRNQRGQLCMEPQEMGKVLHEYFSSVITVEKGMRTREQGAVNGSFLKAVSSTVEEVLEVIMGMKVDKSSVPDQIYLRTEWKAREKIAGALVEIYELSTNMSEVPAD